MLVSVGRPKYMVSQGLQFYVFIVAMQSVHAGLDHITYRVMTGKNTLPYYRIYVYTIALITTYQISLDEV